MAVNTGFEILVSLNEPPVVGSCVHANVYNVLGAGVAVAVSCDVLPVARLMEVGLDDAVTCTF